MIKGNDDTRFGRRLESLFWWILRLFPLILLFCVYFTIFRSVDLFEAILHQDDSTLVDYYFGLPQLMSWFCGTFTGSFFLDSLNAVLGYRGILPIFHNNSSIFFYFSYLIGLEILRFFLNFIVFIVRLANNLFEKMCR